MSDGSDIESDVDPCDCPCVCKCTCDSDSDSDSDSEKENAQPRKAVAETRKTAAKPSEVSVGDAELLRKIRLLFEAEGVTSGETQAAQPVDGADVKEETREFLKQLEVLMSGATGVAMQV